MESHGRLDLPAGDGVLLVVVGQTRLGGNPLEDVVDKRVHDEHGLAGDARIRVDLLHHLVDVDGVAPNPTVWYGPVQVKVSSQPSYTCMWSG